MKYYTRPLINLQDFTLEWDSLSPGILETDVSRFAKFLKSSILHIDDYNSDFTVSYNSSLSKNNLKPTDFETRFFSPVINFISPRSKKHCSTFIIEFGWDLIYFVNCIDHNFEGSFGFGHVRRRLGTLYDLRGVDYAR